MSRHGPRDYGDLQACRVARSPTLPTPSQGLTWSGRGGAHLCAGDQCSGWKREEDSLGWVKFNLSE